MNSLIPMERKNGMATVTSIEVAKDFKKDHCHVVRDIEKIVISLQSSQNWIDCKDYFISGTYVDRRNRKQPMYYLTRDGFQLLAMGFTGESALQWKLKYIETFDKMETAIRKVLTPTVQQPTALDALKQTVAVLDGLTQKITALEDKQSELEKAVNKVDWLTDAKQRVEAITGKPFKSSMRFLSDVYAEIEKTCNIRFDLRLTWQRKKMLAHGSTYREVKDISKLYIISLDEKLKTAFDRIVDRQ